MASSIAILARVENSSTSAVPGRAENLLAAGDARSTGVGPWQ